MTTLHVDRYLIVREMAAIQSRLEAAVVYLETSLKEKKALLRDYQEFQLPEEVDELEWDDSLMELDEKGNCVVLKIPEGPTITVQDTFHAHLPSGRHEEALHWIAENGGASLLSIDVSLSFGRGEEEAVGAVVAALQNVDPEREIRVERTIHPSTLKKFCREAIAEGLNVPEELIPIFNRRVATVAP